MTFRTEAELCAAFLGTIPKEWTPYPETGGFDILLVHSETGIQIGIEAKLVLNAKVLCQASDWNGGYSDRQSPDFRAVLIGKSVADMVPLAAILGLTILQLDKGDRGRWRLHPNRLPAIENYKKEKGRDRYHWIKDKYWVDQAPVERVRLPEYQPHVAAGVPSPKKLSDWTISAIKLCIFVERLGYVTRQHFDALSLNPSLWFDLRRKWMAKGEQRGQWIAGPHFPARQYEAKHPITWTEIESDFAFWGQAALLGIEEKEKARGKK